MFTAFRNRFRRRGKLVLGATWEPRLRTDRSEADALAKTQAKVDALKHYLASMSEDQRAEYAAAAKEYAAAMEAIGANSVGACYRGEGPKGAPEGVRSIEELRFLTKLLHSIPPETISDGAESADRAAIQDG